MIASLWVCVGLFAQSPPASATDWDAYKQTAAQAGRTPEAHIKLALWCESHGLNAERFKHLACAVLSDPKNTLARGMMGLVDYRGRWESPEVVSQRVKSDEALTAKLAEYEKRRAEVQKKVADSFVYPGEGRRLAETYQKAAQAHVRLALWCEKEELKPEAIAHFTEAAQLDPVLRTPWEHLGCKKHKGRWMTDEQVAAEQRETEAQHHADRYWEPLLRKWKLWLGEKARRADAESHLANVTDPRAFPSVWQVFAKGDASDRLQALRLMDQINSPATTRALVMMAVFGGSDDLRARAAAPLSSRDPRDVIPTLIDLIRRPLQYTLEPPKGYDDRFYNSRGTLVVEGERSIIRRSYRAGHAESRLIGTLEYLSREAVLEQQIRADLRAIEQSNQLAIHLNERIVPILVQVTGRKPSIDVDVWRIWWADQQGYVYEPIKSEDKPTGYQTYNLPPPVHTSCFAAGTLVQTRSGPRPIESLQLGDTVLSQDTRTGALSYQPVVAFHQNKPNQTLRIRMAGEAIVSTGIHRFWKAGRGWVMARDLKAGDSLRIVGGTARIEQVEPDTVQPVYNLDVANNRNFFVGKSGLLAHDFGLVESVPEPFDAAPSLEGR